jgi:ABC-type uncharacterized transport system substrate-binding protein
VKRRTFITLLGGAAAAWPLAARAQPEMPVVGFLRSTSLADSTTFAAVFRRGLKEAGFVQGQNVAIEERYADNQIDRLPAFVGDFLSRPVSVIVGNTLAALAARAATATVPIVFTTGSDPVKDGLVASLNRPGGNVTGVSFLTGMLGPKRLELLQQLLPKVTTIAMLSSSASSETVRERMDVQEAAQAVGQQLIVLEVNSERDIETAFSELAQSKVGAVLVGTGPLFLSNREKVAALEAHHALPTMYSQRDHVTVGGLMSYGASITDAHRQAGIYAGRILRGEKPADLPVMQATKFEFVINLKTANKIGLALPLIMQMTADEVIE